MAVCTKFLLNSYSAFALDIGLGKTSVIRCLNVVEADVKTLDTTKVLRVAVQLR